jgi:hypothetical protein
MSDVVKKIYRGMEQLVARRAHNPKVAGSSPAPATMKKKKGRLQQCRRPFSFYALQILYKSSGTIPLLVIEMSLNRTLV